MNYGKLIDGISLNCLTQTKWRLFLWVTRINKSWHGWGGETETIVCSGLGSGLKGTVIMRWYVLFFLSTKALSLLGALNTTIAVWLWAQAESIDLNFLRYSFIKKSYWMEPLPLKTPAI